MLADLNRVDHPAARHAEMENQRITPIRINKAIFCAPPKPRNPRPLQPLAQVDGDGSAQIGTARLNQGEHRALEHGGQPANSGFYFWKLRHGFPLAGAARLG